MQAKQKTDSILRTLQFPVKSGRIEHRNINHIWGKHG